MPVNEISSVAFGGPNLDTLYVTTGNLDGKQPEASGHLYKVTGLCAKGYAGVKVNLYDSCKSLKISKHKKCHECHPFCGK